jgi:hypothetical protein
MRGGIDVGHGVEGQRHVEAVLMGLSGGGLDALAGCRATDDDLGDAEFLEVFGQVGVVERAPGVLGDGLVAGLLVELGEEVRPAVGEVRWVNTLASDDG